MIKATLFLTQVAAIAATSLLALHNVNMAAAQEHVAEPAVAAIGSTRPQQRPQRPAALNSAVTAEVYCMAEALYWEGRNQSDDARQAIGNVIENRVAIEYYPDTICGVVHQGPLDGSAISRHRCQFSYFCDGRGDDPTQNTNIIEQTAWTDVQEMAHRFVAGDGYADITNGSDYYLTHAAANASSAPRWSKVYPRIASIGDHYFHKWK